MTIDKKVRDYSSAVEEMNKVNPYLNNLVGDIMCSTKEAKIQIYKTELDSLKLNLTENCYCVYNHIYENMVHAYTTHKLINEMNE